MVKSVNVVIDEEENDTDTECMNCKTGYNWEDIKVIGTSLDPMALRGFLQSKLGDAFDDWNINEVYTIDCSCGHRFVIAEVPEACEPDENGICHPGYLTLGAAGKRDENTDV